MSSLTAGFSTQMCKRVASAQGDTTPGCEVFSGKRPKRSGPDEEAQKSRALITLDSLERAFDANSYLEGATQEASRETCASLESGSIAEGPPGADKVVGEAPLRVVVGPLFLARLVMVDPRRPRGTDRLVLKAHVKPTTWD